MVNKLFAFLWGILESLFDLVIALIQRIGDRLYVYVGDNMIVAIGVTIMIGVIFLIRRRSPSKVSPSK